MLEEITTKLKKGTRVIWTWNGASIYVPNPMRELLEVDKIGLEWDRGSICMIIQTSTPSGAGINFLIYEEKGWKIEDNKIYRKDGDTKLHTFEVIGQVD